MGHRAPSPPRSPGPVAVVAAALLLSVPAPARGQSPGFSIQQHPAAARAGDDVAFALAPVPGGLVSCSWHRAASADAGFEILAVLVVPPLGQQDGPAHTGRETGDANCTLRIAGLRPGDAGPYTVAVRHPGLATATTTLLVHVPLPQPLVTPGNATVLENSTVALSCLSPAGTQAVAWLRDGVAVTASGHLSLSPDNRTLTLQPAQRGDSGAYACRVSNAVSANRSDDVNVTVLYGPDAVTVTPPGPLRLALGSVLELHCAAPAAPAPVFSWAHGNRTLATGPRLRLQFEDPGQAGGYRCRATNLVLGQAAEATVLLLLLQDQGLASGAVAGVVVGTLLGLGLLVATGYGVWRCVGRSSAPAPSSGAKPSSPPCENPAADNGDGTEVKYLTLTFNTPGGAVPRGPPQLDSGIVYSEVRRN